MIVEAQANPIIVLRFARRYTMNFECCGSHLTLFVGFRTSPELAVELIAPSFRHVCKLICIKNIAGSIQRERHGFQFYAILISAMRNGRYCPYNHHTAG